MKKAIIKLNFQPSGGKTWCARITGRDEKFGFARAFLPIFSADRSGSGKTGTNRYELVEGEVYETSAGWKDREFVVVDADGDICTVSATYVSRHLDRLAGVPEPAVKPIDRAAVMSRAWEIARYAQKNFGGKSREYYAEALRMAWAEARA